jgi:hypothetical protein
MNIRNYITKFLRLAAAHEFLQLRNLKNPKLQLWFTENIAKRNNDSKNFAILDNKIIKVLKDLNQDYYFTEDDITNFYLDHPKTQDLIYFICNSYNKFFPKLNSYSVLDNLKNDGTLDPESGAASNPIFILIHDLIHQVIEADFIEQLQNQKNEETDENITLLDQLNEDLASTLSNFQPDDPNQGLQYYLKQLFFKNLKSNKNTETELKYAIEKTFYQAKAELRNKIDKLSLNENYKNKIKNVPPKLKQLIDGLLSKIKHKMIQKIDELKDNSYSYNMLWKEFELEDIFEQYNLSILESNVIEQSDSSALKAWMLTCLPKMKELLNYFETEFPKQFQEYSEESDY